jgi:hypothetical protein
MLTLFGSRIRLLRAKGYLSNKQPLEFVIIDMPHDWRYIGFSQDFRGMV